MDHYSNSKDNHKSCKAIQDNICKFKCNFFTGNFLISFNSNNSFEFPYVKYCTNIWKKNNFIN